MSPEVTAKRLRRRVDPASLRFASTAELAPLSGTVGQPRALDAITYGLGVSTPGHHIFVAGTPGSGRTSTVLGFLEEEARRRRAPDDWVYVHNFAHPDRPDAIRLPAGRGAVFERDMAEFVLSARLTITQAFESESYAERERGLMADIGSRREALVQRLKAFAAERSYALEVTPVGIMSVAIVDGKPLTPERAAALDPLQRRLIEKAREEIEARASAFARDMHQLAKEASERMRTLEREVASFALDALFHDLSDRYREVGEVLSFLDSVRVDLLTHVDAFRSTGEPSEPPPAALAGGHTSRYAVNVLVDNSDLTGAPVVVETSPQYRNLVGRVAYRPTLGAMVTDFREIKAGALHRANGGFLVLDALDILRHPFAWEALKRCLRANDIQIENMAEEYASIPTPTLRPEPVPLEVKVVLIGTRALYHLLHELDEDFRELFRVRADFAPDMPWSRESHRAYAAFVGGWARENGLLHCDAAAVARLIEYGARLCESQKKLSTRLIEIADVATEASYVAGSEGRSEVTGPDVAAALSRRHFRSSMVEERLREMVAERTLVVETRGSRIGVVNGLSVLQIGDYAFGLPGRVSARVALGRGSVASIEREIELSGPIHSKGFLTISGFLAGTYAQECPLALSATITFEQTYNEVEGDSASSAELLALISALAEVPMRQDVAVTGSVDQHGNVQAVGGVNEKIEGFYATCLAAGLTGSQGVALPAANLSSLMLDDEVVEAVEQGRFHVWTIKTIDEGIELLTGRRAGKRGRSGSFPTDTVHDLVDRKVWSYAATMSPFVGFDPNRG